MRNLEIAHNICIAFDDDDYFLVSCGRCGDLFATEYEEENLCRDCGDSKDEEEEN